MKQIGLRVPSDLLERVDEARGQVPREAFIRQLLSNALDEYDEQPQVPEAVRTRPSMRSPGLNAAGHLPTCGCAVCMAMKA